MIRDFDEDDDIDFIEKLLKSDLNKMWDEEIPDKTGLKAGFSDSYSLICFPFAHFKIKRLRFEKDIDLARKKIRELILQTKTENDILPIKDFHTFCKNIWLGIHEKKDV